MFRKSRLKWRWVGIVIVSLLAAFYVQAAYSGKVACQSGFSPTKQMPISGKNFSSYCAPCIAALRTYAREPVIDTVVAAYEDLATSHPKVHFLYGEIGFPDGGRFRPHRTHRKGLSVDLMVPLQDGKVMKTSVSNRYGYDVEFAKNTGVGKRGDINFSALAALIQALDTQAKNKGGSIRRIFFAPDLQPQLMKHASSSVQAIRFNKKQSWVRHDDHIHVDFVFPCDG